MSKDEAMKLALEALERALSDDRPYIVQCKEAITALRQALEQPEPEPVAWMVYTLDGKSVCVTDSPTDFTPEHRALPLYTSPPKREWQGLTDEDVQEVIKQSMQAITGGSNTFTLSANSVWTAIVRAVEAKLKEKNNG